MGSGGVTLKNVNPPRRYYQVVMVIALITTIGFVVCFDGLPVNNLMQFLVLGLLMIYAHSGSVQIGKRMSFSLSTVTIFPLIFLFGTTSAMIMAGISGLLDGLLDKKSWDRIVFNVSQLALCSMLGSVTFKLLNGSLDPLTVDSVLALGISSLVFVSTNILIVTYLIALHSGTSWQSRLTTIGVNGFYNSLGTSFMGLIFTLFVVSYRFWGLVAFGALFVHFSELLKATALVGSERERRRELEEELVVDELTQAYNFRYLHKWLNNSEDEQVAILFVDIDDFKIFNDSYSHAEGDRVLKAITQVLKDSVRANDKIVRYGGDEFVVLLPGLDSESAKKVAQRVQNNLNQSTFGSYKCPVTCSIGVAAMPYDTTDKRELVLLADQAMYAAKDAGKNTFRVYYPEQGPA